MNQYVTGTVIKELREKNKMTQAQLAEKLFISDRTVSKWETGKGYPDISLIEPIAKVFGISLTELFSGETVSNTNLSSNMLRSGFSICPVCGNIIHSIGSAVIHCHGIQLTQETAETPDDKHRISIEKIEDEFFVSINHEMTKQHYISFIAAVSSDRVQTVKLYPEGNAEARFKINDVRKILYYCNRDGLFYVNPWK